MSANVPRPPRPPRPGSGTQAPAASSASAGGFGDTRTVILSRKSMSMMQSKKEEEKQQANAAAAAPAAPQLAKAKVVDNTVYCVKCPGNFPILGEEYYGAVVECPDCAAEFIIPTQAELAAAAPAPAPVAPAVAAPAPAPVAAAPVAAPAAVPAAKAAPAKTKAKAKTKTPTSASVPSKKKATRKPARNVPAYIRTEVRDGEEVFFCAEQNTGSGSGAGLMGALIAGIGGIVAPFSGQDQTMMAVIAGVSMIVGILVGVVLGKKAGGNVAIALTDERVIGKPENNTWVVESSLED